MAEKLPPPPRVVPIPSDRSWFDGRLLTAATYIQQTDVVLALNVVKLLVKPNPSRIAVGFSIGSAGFVNVDFGPWSDPNSFVFGTLGTIKGFWFTLFNYPGLVQEGWYANPSGNITVRVTETIRNNG